MAGAPSQGAASPDVHLLQRTFRPVRGGYALDDVPSLSAFNGREGVGLRRHYRHHGGPHGGRTGGGVGISLALGASRGSWRKSCL